MFEEQYLSVVKKVEEQLLRMIQENNSFQLSNLVAIFSARKKESFLAVYNEEVIPSFPNPFEVKTLKQLLCDDRDLSSIYDGIVITFEALGLFRSDIISSGTRFYPIELLYRRLNQREKLPQTQLKLARTLFSVLVARGELRERASEYSQNFRLKKVANIFKLSLPLLLESHQIEGLLAIVPDENFMNYLDQQQCSLIYVTTPTDKATANKIVLLDLETLEDSNITTGTQLCATFEEVGLFNPGINPRMAGFVDLRKELLRNYYSSEIRSTIKQFAQVCEQRSRKDKRFTERAHSLTIELELADQELDDMVGSEFTTDLSVIHNSSLIRSYYLTVPDSVGTLEGVISLEEMLNRDIKPEPRNYVSSLNSFRQMFLTMGNAWYPLSDTLLRLDRLHVLARSTYLTSRLLGMKQDISIDKEIIVDEAALSCYVYSLAEPFYNYWPHGEHSHQLLQSYENFHEQLDILIGDTDGTKRKSYFSALKIWWCYQKYPIKIQEGQLIEAIKELESIKGSKNIHHFLETAQLYELFSELLRMFSNTWRPADIREKLLSTGNHLIVESSSVLLEDLLNPSTDLKQPSPLFFEGLNEFLKLSEDSYKIRINPSDPAIKAEKLTEIGIKLGEKIGTNFKNYLEKYSELHLGLRVYGEDNYVEEIEIDENLEDSFLLPLHERFWIRSLYHSAIETHAAIIYNLQGKLMRMTVTPTEATQYVSTSVEIKLNAVDEMLRRGSELEVILSSSEDYEIQSRVVRKKFGIGLPVKFTVVFHKTGDVALLFEHIVDKREHYQSEAWVHVIGLETQSRKLKNPYQYGDVILSPEKYYGRREELMQILDELYEMAGGRQRQNFRLHGIRRSGKTSLLHMIRKSIEEPETQTYFAIPENIDKALKKWHPVFYDLQALPRDPADSRNLNSIVFFRSLVQKICEALHWSKENTDTILVRINEDLKITQNIVAAAKTQIEQVLKRLPPSEQILVLLDEVDLIAPERDERFFGQLRSIILSPELRRITWLLTSIRVLQADAEGVESPLHNIFAAIMLRNLDPVEARRLILEPARKENIYFEPEAVDTILQQTGRQPFFLQVVCHMIVNQLNKEETAYVSKPLADTVIEKLQHPGTVIYEQCGFLWNWAKKSRRLILALLTQYLQGISKSELVEAFRVVSSTDEEDSNKSFEFAEAWDELFANDLVSQDQDGFCSITIPMFQQWLNQRDLDLHNLG